MFLINTEIKVYINHKTHSILILLTGIKIKDHTKQETKTTEEAPAQLSYEIIGWLTVRDQMEALTTGLILITITNQETIQIL